METDEPCGIINLNKPTGCTSRDCVNRLQKQFGRKVKIGHAGTLDPMATGVLLICLGKATKLIPVIHEFSKEYVAGFTLGQTSDTDDSTGEISLCEVESAPEAIAVNASLMKQVGTIEQVPPQYSAVKVKGRRAFAVARKGELADIKSRPVIINEIEVRDYQYPTLNVRIRCGSGTYIRSIGRDLGESLGCGALMHALVRTSIGPFSLENAVGENEVDRNKIARVECLFDGFANRHTLSDVEVQELRYGRKLNLETPHDSIVAFTDAGRFAAKLVRVSSSKPLFRSELNWVPHWYQ